jgi:hypothetical protein
MFYLPDWAHYFYENKAKVAVFDNNVFLNDVLSLPSHYKAPKFRSGWRNTEENSRIQNVQNLQCACRDR